MSIKIIPREKVYFRDWVEKNGIEVEVRENSDGSWTAVVTNAEFTAACSGCGADADMAIANLAKRLNDHTGVFLLDGRVIPIPVFDRQAVAFGCSKHLDDWLREHGVRSRPYTQFTPYYGVNWGRATNWSGGFEVKRPCGCTAPCKCMGS